MKTENSEELKHYGVPGMKWGRHKASYITVRRAVRKAKKAGAQAAQESFTRDKKTLSGLGSGRKALNNASRARKQAFRESLAKDRAYNKELRQQKLIESRRGRTDRKLYTDHVLRTMRTVTVTGLASTAAYKSGKESLGDALSIIGTAKVVGSTIRTIQQIKAGSEPKKK